MDAPSRTIPLLPCRSLEDSVPFYEALGFRCSYRQSRPNPYAVMERGDIAIHLFGMPEFDPADSYGSAIIQVADPHQLYRELAAGLRQAYGKLPTVGIPRILRPRKKQGSATVHGFTMVDPGGNWLRVAGMPSAETSEAQGSRLSRAVEAAARQGDSHGDETAAIRVLVNALARHPDAPAHERVSALLYLAELRLRTGDPALARETLAEAKALYADARASVDADVGARLDEEFEQIEGLLQES